MNYRHAFHAGNHADVLKHIVVLAMCDALTSKPSACFALDTHAGRGLYALAGSAALKTGESDAGIGKLAAGASKDALIARYLAAIDACRLQHGKTAYPGSPWLLAHALRAQDRIAAWELQPIEAAALQRNFGDDKRFQIHPGDGYSAIKASLPPRDGATKITRGLVLIDPPYEVQLQEFDAALAALREGLTRWPQGMFALWYPIKLRRALQNFYRRATTLPGKSVLIAELLMRPDDSPLRMNGSGMLLLNAPWKLDQALLPTLSALRKSMGEAGASHKVDWLRAPE